MERRAKILLIDDDPDFVEATKVVLESRPYEIITALGGEEGLKKAREEKPDLILLDVIMPDINGFQVCQQLKKDLQLSQIPVIMITSFSEKYRETSIGVNQGLSLEAEDFVDKPVAPTELLIRVEKWLKSKK
ncbi:MAG: response regulator [Dehalococcoidales bacterium]|nr:response regulator [Dehalococcoidales bacterium]